MGTGLKLELRQSQQLVMTPQLQQAIKLLQMSNLELSAFVEQELERNPLLRREDPGEAAPDPRAARDEPAPTTNTGPDDGADRRVTAEGDQTLAAETFDTGSENLYDRARADMERERPISAGAAAGLGPLGDEDAPDLEAWLVAPTSLRDHLSGQIGQVRAGRTAQALAVALIDELDEDGYFRSCPQEIAARLGVEPGEVIEALGLIQACDPTGIGARDLAECLALQLAERDRLDPAMRALIDNLELVARGEAARLRALCGVEAEDIADMLAELRRLDPRPGAAFATERSETVVPDVFLSRGRMGEWLVELNADTLPKVLIDRRYAAELAAGGAETKRFVAECRDTAAWLVKSLDQRARTILAVATEIARKQEGFFAEGMSAMRPLSLRQVADEIGMHESTVSRVTANKYMATERGIFPFKFFFSNAVGSEEMSAERVRHRLRALIEAERPGAVLSDDKIVELLRDDGIEVARRTVAKYRKSLKIPSSAERRRRFAMVGEG